MTTMMEIPDIQIVTPQPSKMPQVSLNGILQTTNGTMQTTDLDNVQTTTTLNEDSDETYSFENSSFVMEEETGELPPLTYVDFMPHCLGTFMAGSEPEFADFK